jgi:hypothetical protein
VKTKFASVLIKAVWHEVVRKSPLDWNLEFSWRNILFSLHKTGCCVGSWFYGCPFNCLINTSIKLFWLLLLLLLLLLFLAVQPSAGYGLLVYEVSWSHTTTRHSRYSSGRVISSSQRPLPDNNTHNRQTSMLPVEFEPIILADERP